MAALKEDISGHIVDYEKKRGLIVDGLRSIGYELDPPEGAFYLFVPTPKSYGNSTAFVEAALEKNLLLVPGSVFSERDTHFRISYAATDSTLLRALAVFRELNA